MNSFTSLVTDLMGTKLQTPHGEEIGVVQNVMLNPTDGTVTFIFLCYANFVGKVHRHFAIPRKEMKFISENEVSYFVINERRLKNASATDGTLQFQEQGLNHIYELQPDEETPEPQIVV